MPTYGGVTFYVLAEDKENTLSRPMLVPEDWGIHRQKIPYANQEQLQFVGKGNVRLTLKCEILDDDDFATLRGMVADGVSRTLGNPFGDSVDVSNMLLMEMRDVWRVTFQEEVHFTAVFEQVAV